MLCPKYFLAIGVPPGVQSSPDPILVWTQDAGRILGKIRRCKEALGTAHEAPTLGQAGCRKRSASARLTETSVETPASCIVTP